MAEYLFADSEAWPVLPTFHDSSDIMWGSLQGNGEVVIAGAWDYKDTPEYPRLGPLGLHPERDWAFSATWYRRDEHWRAYIPKFSDIPDTEWFADKDLEVDRLEYDHQGPAYVLPDEWIKECKAEISTALACCRDLRDSRAELRNTFVPIHFSCDRLLSKFRSTDDVEAEAADAKRCMVDALGYISWWRNVFGESPLLTARPQGWVTSSQSWKKRGVLVDLSRDWRDVNLYLLVKHNAPIFYPWTVVEAAEPRFERLSPGYAQGYLDELTATDLLPTTSTLSYSACRELMTAYPSVPLFDHLLQTIDAEYTPDPDRHRFDGRDPDVYVCDGEGWKRRQVWSDRVKDILRETLHFNAWDEGPEGTLVYWRWRQKLGASGERPFSLEDLLLAKEQHKLWYAPLPGYSYDVESGAEVAPRRERRLSLAELTAAAFQSAREKLPDYKTFSHTALPRPGTPEPHHRRTADDYAYHREDKRERSRRRAAMDLPRSTSPYRWERYTQHQRGRPSKHERDFRTDHPRRYGEYANRYTLEPWSPRAPSSVFTSPEPQTPRSTRRSASPFAASVQGRRSRSPALQYQLGSPTSNPTRYVYVTPWVASMRSNFQKLTQLQPSYSFSLPAESSWDASFMLFGVLEVQDERNRLRLKYWANTSDFMTDISQLLLKAIGHGIRFRITVPTTALERWKPGVLTKDDVSAGGYYAPEFIEAPLTWERGGVAFRIRWRAAVTDVLRRPHARAVVFLGGPLHWIARKFKGDALLLDALTGPSIQVSVHQSGYLNAGEEGYYRSDDLSPGEQRTLYGFTSGANGDGDRTLFPTEAILATYLNHWTGEWNDRCQSIFETIWDNIHDRDMVLAMTPGQWNQFLRGNNRGIYAPAFTPTDADWTQLHDELSTRYPKSWDRIALSEAEVPEISIETSQV